MSTTLETITGDLEDATANAGFIGSQQEAFIDQQTNSYGYNRVLEISHLLQGSLSADQVLQQYADEVSKEIPYDAFYFVNSGEGLEVKRGMPQRHSCELTLNLQGQRLGLLQFMRRKRFSDAEINRLEYLTAALFFPLRNAIHYARALRTAYQDPLTGAYNRAAMDNHLEREYSLAKRRSESLSVLMLDIDHFKHVNDTHGHASGDTILRAVAQKISDTIRTTDVLYRYGGEEFLVILPSADDYGALQISERVRKAVADMDTDIGSLALQVTVSAGTATLIENEDVCHLLHRADKALYAAKRQGRNRVIAAE